MMYCKWSYRWNYDEEKIEEDEQIPIVTLQKQMITKKNIISNAWKAHEKYVFQI
jgi:hypothetical protein